MSHQAFAAGPEARPVSSGPQPGIDRSMNSTNPKRLQPSLRDRPLPAPRRAPHRLPLLQRGLALAALAGLGGCANLWDASGGLAQRDYRDLHAASSRLSDAPAGAPAPKVPALRPLAVLPAVPLDPRLVSVSLSETVPVREALIMLATRMNVDYDLDPRISGGIVMRAQDRPFSEVIERIADLAGLRYRLENNRLRVELDEPFHRNYPMGTINLMRRAGSSVTSSAGALGGKEGSSSSLNTQMQVDFWQELTLNVSQILKTMEDRRALRVPLPSEAKEPAENFQTLAYGAGVSSSSRATYTINRQAGVLSLYASERQHREVERYLNSVVASVNQQVLIDARIIEVTLKNEFETGINWDMVFNTANLRIGGGFGPRVSYPGSAVGSSPTDRLAVGLSSSNISMVASVLEKFGTTRTLSSPRIAVMNNQMGIMKVARDLVFFDVKVQRDAFQGTLAGNVAQNITTSSTAKTVPVGLVLTVQPSVDVDSRLITLSIRPSVSRVQSFVSDPAVAIEAARAGLANVQSQVPVIEMREFDSVVNMRSGQVVVMGGLRENTVGRENAGLPGLKDMPAVGWLAGSRKDADQTTELIIFLRATLAEHEGIAPADRRIYETFASDPRPLVF